MYRSTPSSKRSGLSLVETMVSIAVLGLLALMLIPTLIHLARIFKGMHHEQEFLKQMTYLTQVMEMDMTQTHTITYIDANSISYVASISDYAEDSSTATGFVYNQGFRVVTLTYIDGDSNPITTQDNILEYEEEIGIGEEDTITETKTILTNLSPLLDENGATLPIFTHRPSEASRPFIHFQANLGDRFKASDTGHEDEKSYDNKLTGPGYQGFTVNYILVPWNKAI